MFYSYKMLGHGTELRTVLSVDYELFGVGQEKNNASFERTDLVQAHFLS